MLIKRVNHKRNYILDVNFKRCDGVPMVKLKLRRARPPGKHENETLKVVLWRLRARSAVPRLAVCGPCAHRGITASTRCMTEESKL